MHVREFMRKKILEDTVFLVEEIKKRFIILKSNKLVFVSQAVAKAVVGDIPTKWSSYIQWSPSS